jgi:hypothetical protein
MGVSTLTGAGMTLSMHKLTGRCVYYWVPFRSIRQESVPSNGCTSSYSDRQSSADASV